MSVDLSKLLVGIFNAEYWYITPHGSISVSSISEIRFEMGETEDTPAVIMVELEGCINRPLCEIFRSKEEAKAVLIPRLKKQIASMEKL